MNRSISTIRTYAKFAALRRFIIPAPGAINYCVHCPMKYKGQSMSHVCKPMYDFGEATGHDYGPLLNLLVSSPSIIIMR